VITNQAFVYFYGDVDFGPQNGVGTDDMDGHFLYSNTNSNDDDGIVKGMTGNFTAKTYEFHMVSLSNDGAMSNSEAVANANDHQQGNDAVSIALADSNTSRAMSFEQMSAFIAANFTNTEAGFNPGVLDYIRDAQGSPYDGNYAKSDDVSQLGGWGKTRSNTPDGWHAAGHWSGTALLIESGSHTSVHMDNGVLAQNSGLVGITYHSAAVL